MSKRIIKPFITIISILLLAVAVFSSCAYTAQPVEREDFSKTTAAKTTKVKTIDSYGRLSQELEYKSGEGYFACDGQIVKIKWVREDLYGPFSYTLEDGTPLTLGVGKTYVGVASLSSMENIAYE